MKFTIKYFYYTFILKAKRGFMPLFLFYQKFLFVFSSI